MSDVASEFVPQDVICGGYLLVRPFERPDYLSAELLPERIITASGCLVDHLPAPDDRSWLGALLGRTRVTGNNLDGTQKWVEAAVRDGSLGSDGEFRTLGTAVTALQTVLENDPTVSIISINLHRTLLRDVLEAEGTGFLHEMLTTEVSPADGNLLGIEVLGHDYGSLHSWLCNSLEGEARDRFGITPNACGLIDDHGSALELAEWASSDDSGAEPCLWVPWWLVDHTPGR